tara:strand:+ start:1795 stop:1968 length:174 start_codon:yes stop_codon:yes gene_type:complete
MLVKKFQQGLVRVRVRVRVGVRVRVRVRVQGRIRGPGRRRLLEPFHECSGVGGSSRS